MSTKRYDPGEPCKQGHSSPRYLSTNACCECTRLRQVRRRRGNPWQHREEQRKRRERPEVQEQARQYRRANADNIRARSRAWAENNPDRQRELTRGWASRNRERMRQLQAAWREANPESVRASEAKWNAANPEKCTAKRARREANKRNAPGRGVTADEWRRILQESLGLCAYCNEPAPLTMEHVDPIAGGGAHDAENVVAACRSCNSSKSDTALLVWLARRSA